MSISAAIPEAEQQRRRQNVPLYNDNFKLCLFGMNLGGPQTISTADGVNNKPTWDQNVRLAQMVDQAGFEAIVPVCRWIGFGGESNFHARSFETFTWAAGLASITEYSMVVATSQVPALHPIVAAKQGATIDHISNGRFALNLVAGWFVDEMEFFGHKMLDHEGRYAQAEEWLEIVKKLWTVDGTFDYDGRFYHLKRAMAEPKPLQTYPPIFNAASSPRGLEFTGKFCDIYFTSTFDFETGGERAREIRKNVWDDYQRTVEILGNVVIYCAPTEKEAKDYRREVVEKGDWVAAKNNFEILNRRRTGISDEPTRVVNEQYMASYGSREVVGSPEQIADYFLKLARAGCNGVCFSPMGHWEDTVRLIIDSVLPMMEEAGIRKRFRPSLRI